ncbi:MAG: hypothetical protein SPL13_05830 [Clostridia bacterium]|nr:hypothetical protein [Clostridia bacterium]
MYKKKYNEKAITDVYKNAKIAMQSLNDLIPSVKDKELKKELEEEYDGYRKAAKAVGEFMDENKIERKEVGFFQKAGMWVGIKTKVVFDNSKNNVAEMMMKGTTNGINELTAMKNESKNLDESVKEHVINLLKLEESYQQRLKNYL